MDKKEYMYQVREALKNIEQGIAEDIIEDFEAHFTMGMEEGKSEETIAKELGDPSEIAKQLEEEYGICERTQKPKEGREEKMDGVMFLDLSAVSAQVHIEKSKDDKFYINYSDRGTFRNKTLLRFETHQEGDTLYAKQNVQKEGLFGVQIIRGCDTYIDVEIPEDFKGVKVATTSGDVEIEDITTEKYVDVTCASGDVNLEDVETCSIMISTTSGDFELEDCKVEELRVKSVSGDITVDDCIAKAMRYESVSGDIDINLIDGRGYCVTGKTVSGDVCVANSYRGIDEEGRKCYIIGEKPYTSIYAKTVSGDINVD